eukprot:scaffold157622_cov42-Prasinocladus_malaysianus.AAC.1
MYPDSPASSHSEDLGGLDANVERFSQSHRVNQLVSRYADSTPECSPMPGFEDGTESEEPSPAPDSRRHVSDAEFEPESGQRGSSAPMKFSEWLKVAAADGCEDEDHGDEPSEDTADHSRNTYISTDIDDDAAEDEQIAVESLPKQAVPFSEWLKMQGA